MKIKNTMSNMVPTERCCHIKIWRPRTQCQIERLQQKGIDTVNYEGQEHNIKYCCKYFLFFTSFIRDHASTNKFNSFLKFNIFLHLQAFSMENSQSYGISCWIVATTAHQRIIFVTSSDKIRLKFFESLFSTSSEFFHALFIEKFLKFTPLNYVKKKLFLWLYRSIAVKEGGTPNHTRVQPSTLQYHIQLTTVLSQQNINVKNTMSNIVVTTGRSCHSKK